jgi:hypothetical protein
VWSKHFGDSAGSQTGSQVMSNAAGNLVLIGFFSSMVDLGGGPLVSAGNSSMFLGKLAS